MLIDIEDNEKKKKYLRQKLNEILDDLTYDEICGFFFMVFESDSNKLYSICDSEGLLNSQDILLYLEYLSIIKKVTSGIFFKPPP